MTLNFYENLSNDYVKLLENGNIIEIGEPPVMQTFKVHSTVLCYRCPYLYDEFKKSTINNNDNIKIIQKPQISIKVFDIIIKYIYGATINLEKVETSIIFDLLMTANQFNLKNCFQTDFKALQNFCDDIIAKHPNLIFESNDFNTLPEAALVSIIQRDDLQLEESKIWDYVIQWGTAQSKTLTSNFNDWIEKDFQILRNTLQQCLPHIRYFQISNENIIEKLVPFQQIFDKKLWVDILKYSMTPDKPITSTILPPRKIVTNQLPNRGYTFQITSLIITNEHAAEIASWIDKKEVTYDVNNNPYEFNLILRGSRDGFGRDVFWNLYKPITSTILPPRKIVTNQLPNRGYTFQITSLIITNEHAAEIASWIDKKEVTYDVNNNPYEFNLILRGSRDGFGRDVFWNLCNQKTNVVVVVKVKDTDEILGGYNPIGWNSDLNGYCETNDSFIFSLKNRNIENHILSRVKLASSAIYNYSDYYGPNFGGTDFRLYGNTFNIYGIDSFEKLIRKTTGDFSINDYEVFHIKKR
ncbi:hypothetical protein Glove_553g34 [Diversispora epigaea]|uniref:TLDc domain-containing protein n=1 Tax=Diversispora epigaea TaxID=1348612 RepID=A0A397GH13_9GLOM|nr:hypothetical protein Glove_553g34 [Diversispora epigaea]